MLAARARDKPQAILGLTFLVTSADFSDTFRFLRTHKGFCVVSVRSWVSFSFLLFFPAPESHSLLRTETASFHKQLQGHRSGKCSTLSVSEDSHCSSPETQEMAGGGSEGGG